MVVDRIREYVSTTSSPDDDRDDRDAGEPVEIIVGPRDDQDADPPASAWYCASCDRTTIAIEPDRCGRCGGSLEDCDL